MGGKPGIIASLHTWKKTLLLHPHACPDKIGVTCLVTGIGLSSSGELKPAVKAFLLPYDVN